MENAIYWQGRQVGIECDGRILWFPSAPKEAIDAYGPQGLAADKAVPKDDDTARNLLKVAR
ncbi:hypothetical protein [Paraburkholderia phenazinium]|jgi:hypothetical protein|uniref:Uncharacterized protein n=1 Tax=Paraburkholderia phenazinium TaxID=60549 RepID=A0A1G8E1L0_9BURK|nr:hypothetical protein [Paraburkholderia phenazinium]SDH63842.1 hypothetical protein SAMN05216466_111242 [Paraburkholderia phenazinium]